MPSEPRDGWCVGHYILMPDHVHFFARRTIVARPMADWMQMWKSVSSRQLSTALEIAPLFGSRITLIGIYGHEKITAKNGIMWSKTRCELDWLRKWAIGYFAVRSMI